MSSPDFTIYPDEHERVARAMLELEKFEFGQGNETDRKIFEMAAHNEFGKIGIKVSINWEEVCNPDGTPSGVFLPGVEMCGRTRAESETDHDRMRHGIVTGLADGQAGYVREDGTKHEDPIKKIIT